MKRRFLDLDSILQESARNVGCSPHHCTTCMKHLQSLHNGADGRGMCTNCLSPDIVALRLCSGCKILLYCGKACQKADWESHKPWCRKREKENNELDLILERYEEVERWCEQQGHLIGPAAASAMELRRHGGKEPCALVVHLNVAMQVTDPMKPITPKNVQFTHTIREARCMTVSEILPLLDSLIGPSINEMNFDEGRKLPNKLFRDGLVPLMVIDDNIGEHPWNVHHPRVRPCSSKVEARADWLEHFKRSISA